DQSCRARQAVTAQHAHWTATKKVTGGAIFAFDISGTLMSIFFALIAIPALMVMLSITLPARVNRATNLVVASLYIPVMVFNAASTNWEWASFYGLTIGVEVLILAFILRAAGTWPRRIASPATPAGSLDSEPLRTPQQA
ncbi:hypothetical protein ACPW96_21770, partial [Micromonospora sp. DT81.3]